jgi:hypothetical protein
MRKSRHGIDTVARKNRELRKIGSLSLKVVDALEMIDIEHDRGER